MRTKYFHVKTLAKLAFIFLVLFSILGAESYALPPKGDGQFIGGSANPEQQCYDMVQGKVTWSQGGSMTWKPGNVRNLCQGTRNPHKRVRCFERGIAAHNNWNQAINECKAGGGNPEQQCYAMVQGKVAWSQGGSMTWKPGNVRNLCQGTRNPHQRVRCFERGIAVHNNWNQAINECKAGGTGHRPPPPVNPEQQCYNMVQGKVAWSQGGTTKWADGNVRNLCQGTRNPHQRVRCFERGIAVHNNWNQAINECKAGGAGHRPPPPPPPVTPEQQCYNMVQGKVAWSQGGTTKWADGNVRNLCQGTRNSHQRVSCFQSGIVAHNNWNRAINECKG